MSAPADVKALQEGLPRLCRTARVTRSARAVFVGTHDREYALALIEEAAATARTPLHRVSPSGVHRFDTDRSNWTFVDQNQLGPGEMLREAARLGGLVVFEEFVTQVQDGSQNVQARVMLAEELARSDLGENGLVLALVESPEAEAHLPSLIAGQVPRFSLGYPRAGELAQIVRIEIARFAHLARQTIAIDEIRRAAPKLADGLVGLTRKAARDLLHDSLATETIDLVEAERFLRARKAERLRHELAMEVIDLSDAEAPIGAERLLRRIAMLKPRMRLYGRKRARGILIVGPPGTGKTMLARAAGKLTDLPVVVFKVSALMNSLLGETERLFNRAFATLEAMAPAIIFIDEIEKAFSEGNERDGGTMMRVSGALLSWLSDNESPNFIIATCNNPLRFGEIGATMTRSERFDASFFLDVPTEQARVAILRQCLRGLLQIDDTAVAQLAADTEYFSGADLVSAVKLAEMYADYEGRPLSLVHVSDEINQKRSRASALYQQFEPIRRWGADYCEPAS